MDVYKLSRSFWDFAFANPEKIKPNHVAIYFFSIEHCNRLGWKPKFGLPASMVIEAIGIKSYSVYKKTFDDLVSFGFIEVIEYSKNQYSSNIIALKENYKANTKALDKALIKHGTKQRESTGESISSVNKQETKNKEQYKGYIIRFNKTLNKKYRGDAASEGQFNARIKDGFTVDEMISSLEFAMKDSYHIQTKFKYLTPEFFTRSDKIQKFLNSPVEPPQLLQCPNLKDFPETPEGYRAYDKLLTAYEAQQNKIFVENL